MATRTKTTKVSIPTSSTNMIEQNPNQTQELLRMVRHLGEDGGTPVAGYHELV